MSATPSGSAVQPTETDPEKLWVESTQSLGHRSNYKQVWNRQALHGEVAKLAVAGYMDEASFDATAEATLRILRDTVGVGPNDIFLEIGCGVGRVGKVLSRHCLHWIGTDISGEMLRHASRRLAGLSNVSLAELRTVSLEQFPDHSLDVVYCTVVFMHLFEWDRYRYVQEAFRVLRPGGRCYFDNMDLRSEIGWRVFEESSRYPLERRPAHLSMVSTGEELQTYAEKAGFEQVALHRPPDGWVAVTGRKPTALPPR